MATKTHPREASLRADLKAAQELVGHRLVALSMAGNPAVAREAQDRLLSARREEASILAKLDGVVRAETFDRLGRI